MFGQLYLTFDAVVPIVGNLNDNIACILGNNIICINVSEAAISQSPGWLARKCSVMKGSDLKS